MRRGVSAAIYSCFLASADRRRLAFGLFKRSRQRTGMELRGRLYSGRELVQLRRCFYRAARVLANRVWPALRTVLLYLRRILRNRIDPSLASRFNYYFVYSLVNASDRTRFWTAAKYSHSRRRIISLCHGSRAFPLSLSLYRDSLADARFLMRASF